MQFSLSHFELRVRDIDRMEAFYTRSLGFVVTDRSAPGGHQMVFLSRDPGEHHQLVLGAAEAGAFADGSLDHIAFRVASLADLRTLHQALAEADDVEMRTVCHGTSWSIYFHDPEGNRIEFFADTPWHVAQPARFEIDLTLPEAELLALTEREIAGGKDFQPAAEWDRAHRARIAADIEAG